MLKVMMNVIGNVHQPTRTTSFYNKKYPQGDNNGRNITVLVGPKGGDVFDFA